MGKKFVLAYQCFALYGGEEEVLVVVVVAVYIVAYEVVVVALLVVAVGGKPKIRYFQKWTLCILSLSKQYNYLSNP